MSFYLSSDSIKKTGLILFMFTYSLISYAESIDTNAAISEVTAESVNERYQSEHNFPRWPERQQIERVSVPPPPPGPYMSLGLSDAAISESPFSSDFKKSEIEPDPAKLPVDTFSPDVPWPKQLRPTKRWMPDNGYNYVKPQVKKKLDPVMSNNLPSNYNYGYQRRPDMNWSGSRWMPPMGAGSAGPYPYTPNPGYGSSYNRSTNNYAGQSR